MNKESNLVKITNINDIEKLNLKLLSEPLLGVENEFDGRYKLIGNSKHDVGLSAFRLAQQNSCNANATHYYYLSHGYAGISVMMFYGPKK